MRAKYYRLDQAPPVGHWYQKRIGWFGKLVICFMIVGVSGLVVGGRMILGSDTKSLAAQTAGPDKLSKVTPAVLAEHSVEDVVDVQPILDKWSASHPKQKWGIVTRSLEGPSFEAKVNPDKEFESASIYKLFLLLPLFTQIPVEHQSSINVTINGVQKPISTCVDLMLRVSNNECGISIGYFLNWKKADEALKRGGFNHTIFTESNNLRTSAGDTAAFLEALNGDMFNRSAKDTVMRSLHEQRFRDGIPAGCPGCVVANKTGQIDNVMHDAAIVSYKGGSYVLAIFSEGGTFKQIAELTGQIQQQIIDTTTH